MKRMIVAGGRMYGRVPDDIHRHDPNVQKSMRYLASMERKFLALKLEELTNGEKWRIATGKAKGADTGAELWARANGHDFVGYPADWKAHPRTAGPIRNTEMYVAEKPDLVVGFCGGNGTLHMMAIARQGGTQTIHYTDADIDIFVASQQASG
jgi:hypothetical protein